jgi:RNA polymerase sigma-70 factor (ECF subfamily)
MLDEETRQRLGQEIRRLPERQRDVVILRIYEKLSVRETAEAMICREGTVKALLNKAIRRLAREMEKEE